MGFLIQWVIYMVAFVAGSAVAYGLKALLARPDSPAGEIDAGAVADDGERDPVHEFDPESPGPGPLQSQTPDTSGTGAGVTP
ncbi:hypothetical protein [Mycobacterium sp.]|uniref:channel accessory protein ArfB n=1 Tax=Mycobacterium sp. TaxID=1785 RepID=UPI003A8AB219